MAITARAHLVTEPGGPFMLAEISIPDLGPGELLISVQATGLCHTDLTLRAIWPANRLPMVFGHEGVGRVVAVGPGVRTAIGALVVLTYAHCGACSQCRAGRPAYCRKSTALNQSGLRIDGQPLGTRVGADGASEPVYGGFFAQSSLANYAVVTESNAVVIPESLAQLPSEQLPPELLAPLGCSGQTGFGAIENVLRPGPADPVAIFGAGAVGMFALFAALGREHLLVIDPVAARRKLALELGASAAVDPSGMAPHEVAAAVRSEVPGLRHAVDTTARPEVINAALGALEPNGTLVALGLGARTATIDVGTILFKGLALRGVIEGEGNPATNIIRIADGIAAGVIPVDRIVTAFSADDAEAAATAAATGTVIKPVLRWT